MMDDSDGNDKEDDMNQGLDGESSKKNSQRRTKCKARGVAGSKPIQINLTVFNFSVYNMKLPFKITQLYNAEREMIEHKCYN